MTFLEWITIGRKEVVVLLFYAELKPQSSLCEKAVKVSNCSTPINAKKKGKIYAVEAII